MIPDAHSLLRLHSAARGLSEDEIRDVADCVTIRKFAPEDVVIESGSIPESVSLVIGGRFRMTTDPNTSNRIINFGPGDQIGFLFLLHEEEASVAVVADEPSMTLEVTRSDLFRLMREYPLLAKNLLKGVTSGINDQIVRQKLYRKPRTVTFLHTCPKSREVVHRVAKRLGQLGESVGMITDDPTATNSDRVYVAATEFDASDEDLVRRKVAEWADLDRIVFDLDLHCNNIQWDLLARLYSFSQQLYLVITPDTALGQTERLAEVLKKASAWKHKLGVIWLLPAEVQVAPLVREIYELASEDFKVGPEPDAGMDVAIERIVHLLRGVRLGIALGGGAARGMSHYGVLDVLEKSNIVIDRFAGTSVGAMLGVTYCSGYDVQFGIESYSRDLKLPWIYRKIRGGSKWYLLRKYRTRAWDGMLRRYLGEWQLEQLPIPIQTVGVDLVQGEEVVRSRGDAVHAILESINLPYLAPPICRDGQALVDGGMLNVIPADVLVRSGCNYVIAVNVSTKVSSLFARNTSDTPTEKMKVPNVFQVWSRLLDVQSRNLSQMGAASADFTISPEVAKVDIGAFEDTPRIAQLGASATKECVSDLKQQLHQIDAKLFPLDAT